MIIQNVATAAVGVVIPNLVSGSAFEYPEYDSGLAAGVNSTVAGNFLTVFSGSRLILEESELPVSAAYPVIPDGIYIYDEGVAAGQRFVMRVRPTAAGSIRYYVNLSPIG